MSFRYVNPGYVYLLDSNVTATQITDSTYSRTGVAFTQTNSSAGVTIPQFKQGYDFWAKFDVYIPSGENTGFYCQIPNHSSARLFISIDGNSIYESFFYFAYASANYNTKTFARGNDEKLGLKRNTVNTFVLHVVYGDSDTAKAELFFNGAKYEKINEEIIYSASQPKIVKIYAYTTGNKFSNIIFSDTEISPKEQVIALPISATATDMTAGAGGMYTATAAGQTLLQTPDITALAQQFSGESKITGIQVVGNPAYKASTGLETMVGLSKSGNVTTEHGNYTLGTDSTALVMDGWGLSGVTLDDLSNMQFGWKVAD